MNVVGRLAPSPTGELHLGHAYAFLIAWWSARAQGGRVVLRLEDVDAARSSPQLSKNCEEDLRWLGLDWDQRRVQSDGIERLQEQALSLLASGYAYPCTCSRGDIQNAMGAPQQGCSEYRYPGICRGRYASLEQAERSSQKEAGLRFLAPNADITFKDRVFGEFDENPQQAVGDFLILRRNKMPCYQLAVVVDDAFDGVTEVVRGRDLLGSTTRQLALLRALGCAAPNYAHLPLVCDHLGQRLAKRRGALGLSSLRHAGVEAAAGVRWVAEKAHIPLPPGRVSAARLVEHFRWERVGQEDIRLPEDERLALL